MSPRRSQLWTLMLVLATGCSGYSVLGGSRVVPDRHWELSAGLGYSNDQADLPPVSVALQARYGLAGRFDFGLRLFTTGAGLETRIQLYDAPVADKPRLSALLSVSTAVRNVANGGCLEVAGVPRACALGNGPEVSARVRLVVGVEVRPVELILAPDFVVEGPTIGDTLFHAGGSAAVLVRLPSGWRLGPEFMLMVPIFTGSEPLASFPPAHVAELQAGVMVLKEL